MLLWCLISEWLQVVGKWIYTVDTIYRKNQWVFYPHTLLDAVTSLHRSLHVPQEFVSIAFFSPPLPFVPNRATTGVHAPAACLRQHDHVCAQRLVQRHGVWGGWAGWHSHTAQQTGGKNELITHREICKQKCNTVAVKGLYTNLGEFLNEFKALRMLLMQ